MITVRLTMDQESALACCGIEDDTEPILSRTWYGGVLRFEVEDIDGLVAELIEAANAEDAHAMERADDHETARYARAACRSLTALAAKVAKHHSKAQ